MQKLQKTPKENNKDSDSEIMVWGDNKYGQLGVGVKLAGFDFPNVIFLVI
jgi:hypothetical protein